MIFSGMPAISGLGHFLLGRGYSVPTDTSTPGNYSFEITQIPTYSVVLSPEMPIALIVKIENYGAEFTPEVLISENSIPQT
jgi:hypothetical protein